MTSAPLPATPDLMTMLCRIGVGMREAFPSGVFMQFLLLGVLCPRFGALIEAWLFVEERLAAGSFLDGSSSDGAAFSDDDDGGSGWLSQEGPVWRWRHVTRFGSVLVIPILWFVGRDASDWLRMSSVRSPAWSRVAVAAWPAACVFWLGLAPLENCALFVPVC